MSKINVTNDTDVLTMYTSGDIRVTIEVNGKLESIACVDSYSLEKERIPSAVVDGTLSPPTTKISGWIDFIWTNKMVDLFDRHVVLHITAGEFGSRTYSTMVLPVHIYKLESSCFSEYVTDPLKITYRFRESTMENVKEDNNKYIFDL